ncbi:hypothetical protein ACJ41O_012972 [Fusarium nematophilum]
MGVEENNLGIDRLESQREGSQVEDITKPSANTELTEKYGETKRGLKPRHVYLMAIGGSIGVGLWYYGESEFIMASTKVLLLVGLDGVMHPYHADGATGRFLGWWSVVIYAGFTIAGPDMIALAAGEIQNPRRTIPRVARLIFYRIVGFCIVGVLAVGIICSSRDGRLLGAIEDGQPGAAASPWVIGIQNLGIGFLPHLINALIMLSGWSCGNAYLFSSSRTLYGLARDRQAPKFLMKCTNTGVPIYCVLMVSAISCITFLVSSNSAVEVFFWFVDLTTTALIATYTFMLITYLGFYRARKAQGLTNEELPYAAPFAPWTPLLALVVGCTALLFVGFDIFRPFDTRGFVTTCFAIGFAAFMFAAGKVKYWKEGRGGFVDPKEADLVSGKAEIDAECRHWEEGGIDEVERARLADLSWARRTWERMW